MRAKNSLIIAGCPILVLLFLAVPFPAPAAERVQVLIRGLEGPLLENVQKALVLPYGLTTGEEVNTFWLERFRKEAPDKVRRALEPYGYYRAVIRTSLDKTGENAYRLVAAVDPGRPVRIEAIDLDLRGPGGGEQALRKFLQDFPLRRGEVLLQQKYEEGKAALQNRATELGYLDADFPVHAVAVDPDRSTARIELVLDTGMQYRFDSVRFEGATRYPDKFLNRFLAFKPGEIFSYAKLGETQLNLINSERFREVLPVPLKAETREHRVPVEIRLDEAPTKRLRPGLGYATDLGPRFSLEYRDLNVYERGHEFRSELNLSQRLQSLGAGYTLPGEDIDTLTGLQVNLRREDVATYTTSNASAEVNRSASFGRGRLGTVYLRLERERSTVGSVPLDSRLVLPGIRVSEQRSDSLVRPTRGHHYSLDLRGTHQAIGSNNRFLQAIADGSVLVPLPWRLSLYTRARAGATFQNAPVSTLPVSYRFFAGGDRSVRGYSYQSLGPANDQGQVVGGRNVLVGSLELNRALFANWGVAAFYDAGNAFNNFTDIRLFQGAGVGLRYFTIVGALRFDVARQLSVDNPSYRFHLTVGFAL
ncbi:MAG: hypothetical protein A2010_18245 [Nitrospirae bacterium GWD2_57_9]|nr:MAG: hypothetical protein A2010_18245 [Nitrospirae bacterium GWD2_57_9]